jgi:proline iminopeptidase
MHLNHYIDRIVEVNIRGKRYPVSIAGHGIPCLVIGTGLIVQRTLSQQFKQVFEVYASDMYWERKYGLENPAHLTFGQIIEDIMALVDALKISKYVVFGFSVFGLVALEFAKRYPNQACGILMVGTPMNCNASVAAINNQIFEENADDNRKKIDTMRRSLVSQEDLSNLSTHERFKRTYTYRDAPRYWHVPDMDCTQLWEGIELDPLLDHFFENIIPSLDVRVGLEAIQTPVYLCAGLSDFDCCPAQSWPTVPNLPPHFAISTFEKSGHYPQYEEAELFDQRVIRWAKQLELS